MQCFYGFISKFYIVGLPVCAKGYIFYRRFPTQFIFQNLLHSFVLPVSPDMCANNLVRIISKIFSADEIHLAVINNGGNNEKDSQRKLKHHQRATKQIAAGKFLLVIQYFFGLKCGQYISRIKTCEQYNEQQNGDKPT